MTRKILIAGGAGFIGYHLAKQLAEKGNEVTIVDCASPASTDMEFASLLALPNVKIIKADLTDKASWGKVGEGFDYVYHLVSINSFRQFLEIPHEVLRVGITSALNALDWFHTKNNRPNAKILYTSSNEIYAGTFDAFGKLPIPTPENIPGVIADTYNSRWSYAGQKLINELLFIHYANAYKFRMVIVRPHFIYGPKAGYSPMVPKIIERIKYHIDPFPLMGPDDSRAFCYVDDVVEAMIATIESDKTDGGTYNIGSSKKVTIKELVEKMFEIMKWHPEKIEVQDSPDGKNSHFLPDVSKIKKDTGWEAKTSLEEGLRKTVEWYIKNPKS